MRPDDDVALGLLRKILTMDRRADHGYVRAPDDIEPDSLSLDGVVDLTPDEAALVLRLRQ